MPVMVYEEEFELLTAGHRDIHDITEQVAGVVGRSGVRTGLVHVFNVGSTGCVGTIEYEPGLGKDVSEILDRLVPPGREYGHEMAWHDGNAHSHLQATLVGPSLLVPIVNGALRLGTWQQVFHLECDVKPRHRAIIVTIVGE